MKQTLAALGVVFSLVTCAFGCTRAHTVTKVKSAADLSLAFQRIGSATVEPIPDGTVDVNLPMTAIDVDEDGYLQREEGVFRIECSGCLGKTLTLVDGARQAATVDRSVAELVAARHGSGSFELPFEYQVSSAQEIYPLLRTPAANVEYFEQTTEPVSELGWLLIPGAALTLVGAIVMTQDVVPGILMLVPGVALDVFGGIHLVLPDKTQRYNAAGNPIATRAARRAAPARRVAEPEPEDTAEPESEDESAPGEAGNEVDDAMAEDE
jgi:hypothetical protein